MPIRQGVSGLLALLSGGWAQALALPAQAAPARWTPELAFTVKRVGVVAISPDGRWAAVEVAEPVMEAELSEWRPSVHVYPVGAAGQRAWRVETPASSPAWSPDGRWLAFMSNRSGKRNVWRVGLDGTPAEQLTDVVGELGEFRWSPDGRRLAYVVTDPPAEEELRQVREKRDARVVGEAYRFARLYRLDLDAAAGRVGQPLTQPHLQVGGHRGAGLSGAAFDWSPDGSAIAFSHSPSPSGDDWVRADVSVVDVATGRVRPLAATPAAEGGVAWSPDGRWIAVTVSDTPPTYALTFRVVLVSPADGTARPLADSFDRRPAIVGWTRDARAVVISEARGTVARLSALPAGGGAAVDLSPDTLMVSAPTLNPAGTYVGFVAEAPDRAPEPYVSRLTPFAPYGWRRCSPFPPSRWDERSRSGGARSTAARSRGSYVGTADVPGFVGSYFGGEFWDAPELWHDRSAVLNVKAVTTPTLIQHGENDLRVPISQGYELYTALKRRNVPVTMVVYPRQGHVIDEPKFQLDVMRRNLEWFRRWVMGDRN